MADLLGFGGDMPPLDEGPDEYDTFNDETFGDGAEAGDWEQHHEKLAQDFGDLKPLNLDDDDDDFGLKEKHIIDDSGFDSAQKNRTHQDDLEKSMTQFVLDDDDDFFDPAIMSSSKQASRPIPIGGGAGDSNMSQLFGPSSPPALFDPSDFMSPTRGNNIWGSPSVTHHPPPAKPKSRATEDQLKAMLNIGGGGDSNQPPPLEDAAIVKAVPEKKKQVFTLEELERDLTSRAPPRRTKSPVLGSPPPSSTLPIGTPPRHHFMQKAAPPMSQSPGQGSPMTGPSSMSGPRPISGSSPMTATSSMSGPRPMTGPSSMTGPRPMTGPSSMSGTSPMTGPSSTSGTSPMTGSRPMSGPRPQQPLPPDVIRNLTQQILSNVNGRISPTHIAQLIMHMHNTSGRVSPNQISHKLMMGGPPPGPLSSSPGKPPPRMMHPGMRPPPPMMPFSPGGPGRMPHPHTPPGGMHSHPRGRPPMGYMYGLTPMHPRIPPLHARSDPGPRGRFPGRFPPNQYQNRSRTDMRPQRPFNRRYDNQRNDNRGPRDEYSNLMSQREKDWVIKIQMLQLQTNNPYLDDYYYTTYMQRKSRRNKEQGSDGVQSEDRNDGKENQPITPQPKQTETRTYQPTQFAGALGRLTSSSVNNPRQIIDIHIDAGNEEEEIKAKDHSRRRRVLLSIERVYTLLLEVDDLEKQVLTLPQEADRGQLLEKKQALVAQMYALLKADAINGERSGCDHFIQVLSIRKGRKLVSRVIPYLDKEEALTVVRGILQNFGFLLKREMQDLKKESPEETLPQLYLPLSNVVKSTNLKELTNLVHSLIARQPGVSPNRKTGSSTVVISALQNKFGVSVVLTILNQGEHIFTNTSVIDMEQDVQFQWIECVNQLASDICVVSDTSISEPLRHSNYDNVLAHFARFVSKQSYNALDRRLRSITSTSSR